jgi:hypothetical protein
VTPWVLVGVLSVGGAVTAGLTAWKAPRQSPAQNAVAGAAEALKAEGSAAVQLSGTERVFSRSLSIGGSERLDFVHNSGSAILHVTFLGRLLTERTIVIGSVTYVHQGSALPSVSPGRPWIAVDPAQLQKAGVGTFGSGGILGDQSAAIQQGGNTVRDLGPADVRGMSGEAYGVTLGATALGDINRNVSSLGGVVREGQTVYVTGGQLSRVVVRGTVKVSGITEVISLRVDYSQFGQPVHIAAPPPSQVISFKQYLQRAQSATRPKD